jgi:hypothetical protein
MKFFTLVALIGSTTAIRPNYGPSGTIGNEGFNADPATLPIPNPYPKSFAQGVNGSIGNE